jgi:hypothetical protein
LRRQDLDALAPPSEAPDRFPLALKGTLTQLDCLTGPARMHIAVGTTNYMLLIRNPERVAIRNNLGASVDMTCGAQNTAVSVEYTQVRDDTYGTTGDIQSIEFAHP